MAASIILSKIYKRDYFNFEIFFSFLDGVFLCPVYFLVYMFCILFVLGENALMLVTQTKDIYFWLHNKLNKAIDIINFVKHFQNYIADTQSESMVKYTVGF